MCMHLRGFMFHIHKLYINCMCIDSEWGAFVLQAMQGAKGDERYFVHSTTLPHCPLFIVQNIMASNIIKQCIFTKMICFQKIPLVNLQDTRLEFYKPLSNRGSLPIVLVLVLFGYTNPQKSPLRSQNTIFVSYF